MSITIYGYSSFKEWAEAGYPGAVSFDAEGERKPDPRRGLCVIDECPNVEQENRMCKSHHTLWAKSFVA